MQRRRLLSVLPALALLAAPLQAQAGGTFEIGAFARSHWFGESYVLEHKTGPGLRLGYFFARGFELEVDGSWIPTFVDSGITANSVGQPNEFVTGDKVRAWVFHGRLLYHLPIGDHSALMAGAGWGFNRYSDDLGNENGPGGLIGARFGLGSRVSIRVDGTLDYMLDPAEGLRRAEEDWHYGLQAGLSWLFGPRAAESFRADADGDGVSDNLDQCPDTPANTRVNPSGCPPVDVAADTAQADTAAAGAFGARPDTAAAMADTAQMQPDTAAADTAAMEPFAADTAAGLQPDTAVADTAAAPAETIRVDTAAVDTAAADTAALMQPDTAAADTAVMQPGVAPADTAAAAPADTMPADTMPADTAQAQPEEVERTPMPVRKDEPNQAAADDGVNRTAMPVRKDE